MYSCRYNFKSDIQGIRGCILSLLSYYLKGLDISATKALEELRRSYIVGFRTMDGEYEFQRVFLKNIHEDIFNKLGVVYKI